MESLQAELWLNFVCEKAEQTIHRLAERIVSGGDATMEFVGRKGCKRLGSAPFAFMIFKMIYLIIYKLSESARRSA